MQEWFSALELAEYAQRLKVNDLPQTKRGFQLLIDQSGWNSGPLARPRTGRGAGMEYHFSLLPEAFVAALISEEQKQRQLSDIKAQDIARRDALAELDGKSLNGNQRKVMEARASLTAKVRECMIADGCSQRQAVLSILGLIDCDPSLKRLAQQANAKAGSSRKVSKAALYEWLKAEREGGIVALAPKSGNETITLPYWFADFFQHYARPQSPTIAQALDAFLATSRINDRPSYDQVRRALKKLDKRDGSQARHKGREGALSLKARHAYVSRDTSDLLPTSVYTADGKTFDAEIQHPVHGRPFRPEITSILDVATRMCVGWSVGLAENTNGVVDALRHACIAHGIPAIFYVDRGPGFKNEQLDNDLTGFCARLGVTKMHSLPYNSQARGIIERFNGSVWNPLSKELPSYIGQDMDREARQVSFKRSRKELAETGASGSLPTWHEFLEAVGQAVDHYNRQQHDGLTLKAKGRKMYRSPAIAWEDAVQTGFEPISVLPQEADDLFRPYVRRRTRRGLVEWLTNSYFSLDLEPHDGRDVLVGYDIHDATRVWCRGIDLVRGEEQPGRLIAVAEFEGNKERYVPWSAEQQAIEKRRSARAKRLNDHLEEVEAEASPGRFLQASASQPVTFPTFETTIQSSEPAGPVSGSDEAGAVPPLPRTAAPATFPQATNKDGSRPVFVEDYQLANWLIENPSELTERDRSLLRNMMKSKSDLEYLRINGVDTDQLRTLVRATA